MGEGRGIEDVREVREDGLRELIGLKEVPSSSAIGDWLKRMGQRGGMEGLEKINQEVARKVLRKEEL